MDMGYLRLDNNQNLAGIPTDYGFKLDFIRYRAQLDELFADGTRKEARFFGLGSEMDEISTNLTAYISLNWQPNRKITIRPGFASQASFRDLSPTVEPRLRISYRPTGSDNQEFSLALGRYFQLHEAITDERDAGTVFGIYKPIDDSDPYPEALHAIAGYRQRVNRYLELSVEGYAKRQYNIPVAQWTREPGNTLDTGLASAVAYGADLHIELNISPFFLSASYGLSEVTYEAPAKELVAWIDRDIFRYNPTHDQRHKINVTSSLGMGKYTANVNWQLSSGGTFTKIFAFELAMRDIPRQHPLRKQGTAMTLYSEPFDGRFPTFQRVDASLNRPFNLGSNIQIDTALGVINAFDARNVFYFDVNTLQQVDQLPLVPYLSITTKIR